MSTYYISSNGDLISDQEYLVHWGLRKGQKKQNHKYLLKIGEGAKARYLYTQEEVRAYHNRGKQKVKDTYNKTKQTYKLVKKNAEDKIGITARRDMRAREAEFRIAKRTTDNVTNEVKKAATKKDYNRLIRKFDDTYYGQAKKAQLNYQAAIRKYGDTPLGKIEQRITENRDWNYSMILPTHVGYRDSMKAWAKEPMADGIRRGQQAAINTARNRLKAEKEEKRKRQEARHRLEAEQLENERRRERERVNTETERRREEQRRREEEDRRRREEERRRRQAAENEIERQRREGG